jgi:hypothetical protein
VYVASVFFLIRELFFVALLWLRHGKSDCMNQEAMLDMFKQCSRIPGGVVTVTAV